MPPLILLRFVLHEIVKDQLTFRVVLGDFLDRYSTEGGNINEV